MQLKKKAFFSAAASLVALTIVGELFARFYLGLGTPPLSVTHPTIEYMVKPNQSVKRFGNRFISNEYGMRSEQIPQDKASDELRVIIFGDSIINGGNLTDQEDLATSRLQISLAEALGKHVVVGNVSAGSWGPGNWLAYVEEYGFFDADIVVLVISSHDYKDIPSFKPLNKRTHPTETPFSAISEGISRYLPRYFPKITSEGDTTTSEEVSTEVSQQDKIASGMNDLELFLQFAMRQSENVLVFQYWDKAETDANEPGDGYKQVRALCEELGLTCYSVGSSFRKAVDSGRDPYRDDIHPNDLGQRLLGDVLHEGILYGDKRLVQRQD